MDKPMIGLAPGKSGWFDEFSQIHLTISNPYAEIDEGTNVTKIRRGIKKGNLLLIRGDIEDREKYPDERQDKIDKVLEKFKPGKKSIFLRFGKIPGSDKPEEPEEPDNPGGIDPDDPGVVDPIDPVDPGETDEDKEKAEEERKKKEKEEQEKAEREKAEKEEQERIEREKAEAEKKKKEEEAAEQKRKEEEAAEQKRKEEEAAEQKRKEEEAAEQKRKEEAEAAEKKKQQELQEAQDLKDDLESRISRSRSINTLRDIQAEVSDNSEKLKLVSAVSSLNSMIDEKAKSVLEGKIEKAETKEELESLKKDAYIIISKEISDEVNKLIELKIAELDKIEKEKELLEDKEGEDVIE